MAVATLLNGLAASPVEGHVFDQQLAAARTAIHAYVIPTPFKWVLGDVFAFKLSDGSRAYGQVVGEIVLSKTSRQATCALLDHRTAELEPNVDNVRRARALAVLHIQEQHLAAGEWVVIGSLSPMADPYGGPCGHPFNVGGRSWDGLETLANAYFALTPWNAFDRFLLPGVERPANAIT